MPRWLSFATGMLLVPAPARATASTLVGNLDRVHVRRAHEDRVRMTDLGRDLVPVARQPLEPAHRDVVEREDLERWHGRMRAASAVAALEFLHVVDERLARRPCGIAL